MNLLRAAISTQLSFRPPPKCVFRLPPQQASPFSIFAKCSSTKDTLNSQPPKKPRNTNSSHSLTWSQTLNRQPLTSPSACPTPSQTPCQPKPPYFVNLFGVVQVPVQFHATTDGKHMAATFIAQKDGPFIGNSSTSVLVPVLFEGDLASTVVSHVKQNDCVCVTGKLSLNPLPFVLSEFQGKFHLVGNEIKFVQGLGMQGGNVIRENVENKNVVEEQDGNRKYSVDSITKVEVDWDEVVSNIDQWSVIISNDKGMKGAVEGFERKVDGKRIDLDNSTPLWVYKKLNELNSENKIEGIEQ